MPQRAKLKRGEDLDARLRKYSAMRAISIDVTSVRKRIGNWPIFAAAAGSALAMATSASASIITGTYIGGGPNGGFVVQTNIPNIHQQLNILGYSGHLLMNASQAGNLAVSAVAMEIFTAPFFRSSNASASASFARNFAGGSKISAGAGSRKSNALEVAFTSGGKYYSPFAAGQPGYLGFALNVGNSNFDYGWIKMDFFLNPQSKLALEAISFGLETNQNQSIAAGDTGAPEPGTMGLGILAAGAAGVMALRRRRKLSTESLPV